MTARSPASRGVQCGGRQQHQPDWNHARDQPDQSRLGLGGEHAAERRPVYAAGWHDSRGGRVPPGAHRQGVFYTGYAPVAGEQIAVSYRTVGRAVGRAVNTRQPAGAGAGRNARRGRVDRLGDQSSGAQLRGLPQCGAGDGAGGGGRERAVERHYKGTG
jgi:hypothetical protein